MIDIHGGRRGLHSRRPADLHACVLAACIAIGGASAFADGEATWDSSASVMARHLVANQVYPFLWLESGVNRQLVVSPDRQYFFFTTYHGDLACNCNVHELQVFAARDFKSASATPAARQLVTMKSAWGDANHAGIFSAQWEEYGHSIVFLGVDGTRPAQVFELEASSGALHQLTNGTHDVFQRYAVAGNSVVYVEARRGPWAATPQQPVLTDVKSPIIRALRGEQRRYFNTYAVFNGSETKALGSFEENQSDSGPYISPDGRHAFFVYVPDDLPVPSHWKEYDGIKTLDDTETSRLLRAHRLRRYMLIDVEHGRVAPALDAPAGSATEVGMGSTLETARRARAFARVLWSHDSRHAVLLNTALPLTDGAPERRHMPYIIDYEIKTGRWHVLEPFQSVPKGRARRGDPQVHHVSAVSWLKVGREFIVEHAMADGTASTSTIYTLHGAHWWSRVVPAPAKQSDQKLVLADGVTAWVHETANDPFAIVVSNGSQEFTITSPDPTALRVQRARVDAIQWTEVDGHIGSGGLILPCDPKYKQPYPLVIQAHRWFPERFLPDGNTSTAYAAQPLAASGIAVLMLEPVANGSHFVARIDAAVDSLARKGIVDAGRVGLIGVDEAGPATDYVLTHPGRTKLLAAIHAGKQTGSYDDYLGVGAYLASILPRPLEEQMYGGAFWQNKSGWLSSEPTFNADKVQTPVLFACEVAEACPAVLPMIMALHLNGRPLELMLFPPGVDRLYRPSERLASLQATVDWMAFWLKRYIDRNDRKATTYDRWKKMRDQIASNGPKTPANALSLTSGSDH